MLNWDRVKSEKELLIREMLYGNVEEVLKIHPKEELKRVFLENLHRFDPKNRAFWKLALEVSDEEIERRAKNSLREGNFLRNL